MADLPIAHAPKRLKRMPVQQTALGRLLTEYQHRLLLPFDERAVSEFKRLKAAKVKIGTMDLRIASIVLANGATLITRNLRDYEQVPGLQAEDWTAG